MHRKFIAPIMPYLALALAGCRGDSTGTPSQPGGRISLASLQAADAGGRFSPWSPPVNLGPVVNSDGLDQDPTLSPDALSLYFTSDRPGGYGIWASHRDCRDCPWQTPVKLQLVPDDFEGGLGPTQAVGAPAFSRDGHLLFFSRCVDCDASHFPGSSDIFVAHRSDPTDDFGWGPAVPLGPGVNTAANEDHPFYLQSAADGAVNLYFCRNEPGSSRFDIYAAAVTRDGDSRGSTVLVSELSLPGINDVAPTLRADGREMVFQSNRPGGVGTRADLWMSMRRSAQEPWSVPENMGTPVNTSAVELQPSLSLDGRTLMFASDRAGSRGNDIWMSTRTSTGEADSDGDGADHESHDAAPRFSDWSAPVNLGSIVNSPAADFNPSVSKDGLSLYFVAGQNRTPNFGLRDIWVTRRASLNEPWGTPHNLGPAINTAAHESKPTLSRDSHRLYFASNRAGGDWDLYVSRRRDTRDDFGWEQPVSLGSGVNSTASEESGVTILEDEASGTTTLYFASNRVGGPGDFDIYASTLGSDGTFGPAVLVLELSTPAADLDPAIRRDGVEMFLASNRPGTYGATDLWVATRATTQDPWSTPVNLGPVVNSPPRSLDQEQSNDLGPALSFDGTTLYFNSAFRAGNGSDMFDIWVTTRTRLHPPDDDRGRHGRRQHDRHEH